MNIHTLFNTYDSYLEKELFGRYITYNKVQSLIHKFQKFEIIVEGESVQGKDIVSFKIGHGKKKVFMWSQMHGNESTSTKALFDLFHLLQSDLSGIETLLSDITLLVIPMLNPDGSDAYTRLNSNDVDLNRDAVALSQPESNVLRKVFERFVPDICFNLHGQRTIFSAGPVKKSATMAFLSPSQNETKDVTDSRKIGMRIISEINEVLQQYIPNQVGRYDDGYNINCVGDMFQSLNVTTLLYEAGHLDNDYDREEVRKLFFIALLQGLQSVSKSIISSEGYQDYFNIPENEKLFCDILLKNVLISGKKINIGIQFEEVLVENSIHFIPKIKFLGNDTTIFGHQEIDCVNKTFNKELSSELILENEVKFLTFDNENIIKTLKIAALM